MNRSNLALIAALLLLAACDGSGPASQDNEGGGAEGELLEGSISDAMIPVDQVRSQAPLATPEAQEGGTTSTDDADDETDESPDESADPELADPGNAPEGQEDNATE